MACRFLIVDPDRNFREALAIALRLDGHPTDACETLEDGRRALEGRGDGCCVLDAHLAGADELAESALRAGLRLVLTGPYPDVLAALARHHPRAQVLAKPFATAQLTGSSSSAVVGAVAASGAVLRARRAG